MLDVSDIPEPVSDPVAPLPLFILSELLLVLSVVVLLLSPELQADKAKSSALPKITFFMVVFFSNEV
jgi:hypothetical protein